MVRKGCGVSRVLVIYGTTEGHTAKIARSIADTLRERGAEVDVAEASTDSQGPEGYSAVVVAASVHGGTYQRSVQGWVRTHGQALRDRPTAFVSVCLAILEKDPKAQQDLNRVIDRFLTTTKWQPTVKKAVAGALLYTRYSWLKRWIMKRIASKAGGDTDTTRDYEYTDWSEVRGFAELFGERVAAASAGPRQPAAGNVQNN